MAEYTANAVQTVAIGQNVLFTDVPIPGCGQGILHREGSGLITLRGLVRNCGGFARYKISFGANIAAPEGTEIHSCFSGQVTYTGPSGAGGYSITITFGDYQASYCHISPNYIHKLRRLH